MQERSKIYDLSRLEREVHNLTKLVNINRIINSTLDIARLLTIIMEIIKEIMETETSTLLLYEEEGDDLVFKVALGEAGGQLIEKYRVALGQGIAGWVAETRKPLYVNDAYRDRRFEPKFDQQTGFTTKAIICTPLLFKGKLLGVIQAINPTNRPGFDEEDLKLFRVFADQVALAVQNAIFFQNALEEERIKSEITAARAIQTSLVPDLDSTFGNIHVAARSISAREIGGEFYDLFRFGDNYIGIAIGDIHEKGIPGGLRASMVNGALKAVAEMKGENPTLLVNLLNRTVNSGDDPDRNISIFYGVVNISENNLRFINAGAAYPILVRDNVARYLRFGSRVLEDNPRAGKRIAVRLQPRDFFVIISDGILKLKNQRGIQLGLKNIMGVLEQDFSDPQDDPDQSVPACAYTYDPLLQNYYHVTTLEPTRGYWVYSYNDALLIITPGYPEPSATGTKLSKTPPPPPQLTAIHHHPQKKPQSFRLYPNHPNPFNPVTTIRYDLADAVDIKLTIYNHLGQEIDKLFEGYQAAGRHQVTWHANGQPSGLYFYKLKYKEQIQLGKMLLIK